MPAPLPRELRQRVVDADTAGEMTLDEVSRTFQAGTATIKRWMAARHERGRVDPRPMGGKRVEYRISPEGELFLAEQLQEVPDSTLPELVAYDQTAFGVRVSLDTMSRTLHRLGFSRKAVRRAPAARTSAVM